MTVHPSDLTVEHVPTDALRPYPQNPRNGDTDAIVESIRVNGLYKPLVISQDGVILAGNHTYAAAVELGLTTVPVVRVPVAGDSTDAARIVLADNRTSDRAMYDNGVLLELLRDMENDLYGTAFSTDDLDDLLASIQEDATTPVTNVMGKDYNADLATKLDKYQQMGRRMFVLDYDQDTYSEVAARLHVLRGVTATDTNADAVLALLRQHTTHVEHAE